MENFLNVINYMLRGASFGIFFLILYQIFISKKGSYWHIFTGRTAMVFGILIFVLISIRGFTKETAMTNVYAAHLVIGTLFFFSLLMTGYTGYKLKRKVSRFKKIHRRYAIATLVFLLLTVAVGIISYLSHK